MSSKEETQAAVGENGGDFMEKGIEEKEGKRKMSFQLLIRHPRPTCSVFHAGDSIADKRQKHEVLGMLKERQVSECGWSTGSMALQEGVWPWAPHSLLLPSTVV